MLEKKHITGKWKRVKMKFQVSSAVYTIYMYTTIKLAASQYTEKTHPQVATGLEKYLNSTLPVGQVTLTFCLPGALPHLPEFSNSLIIHDPKNGSQTTGIVLLVLITFMFTPLYCLTSTTFNFFILLFIKVYGL